MENNLHWYIIQIMVLYVVCNTTTERNYDIILENVEEDGPENSYMKWDFSIDKYNWTTNVMNGKISVLKDIPSNATVHTIGYERRGNRYQESHINVLMNICKFLNETHVNDVFLGASDFPKYCPVEKGNYTVYNMMALSRCMPKEMSGKYWMMRFITLLANNVLGDVKIYAHIDRTRALVPKTQNGE